ncbi:hypothetical protein MRB53_037867 [Persea americana]|nr:hypothetical protein MRB53_037867 [Persea americana]
MLSTAAYNTWAVGAASGCPNGYVADCANQRGFLFYPNQSLTWIPNSNFGGGIEQNLGLNTNGPVGWDTVALGWQGSVAPKVEHSVILTVYDPRYWLGLFGVNPQPTNFTTLNNPQPSFMQSLYNNGSIPSRSYGYTAGNQYRNNKVFGSLTLGGYDTNRFDMSKALSWNMYPDSSRDLVVGIDTITTNSTASGGSRSSLLPDGHIAAYIDSTVPEIWLPESACQAFEQAFNLTYNSASKRYLVDATTHTSLRTYNPAVTFTLSNGNSTSTIMLPYSAFDLNVSFPIVNSSTYYFPLQRAANDTQYTLGRAFLQEAYLIADYDHSNFTVAPCTWDNVGSTSIKNTLSPSLQAVANANSGSSSSSGISGGAIAGIVIGVLALLAIIGAAVFFFLRRKRQTAARNAVYEKDGAPLTKQTEAAKTVANEEVIEDPNELHGTNLMELDAPHRDKPHEMDTAYKVDHYRHQQQPLVEMDNADDYGRRRHEMEGESTPLYEMAGSDVHEIYSQSPPEKGGLGGKH